MKQLTVLLLLLVIVCSCKRKGGGEEEAVDESQVQTPVTVTTVHREPLVEYAELNATAMFLQKSYVKANVNGYVTGLYTQPGKFVSAGQTLFVLKTKEAQAIGNAVNRLDPSFRFSGVNTIKAAASGYITQLNHQAGDYVQDGEQLAVINDLASFAFQMELPYELKPYLSQNKTVTLVLPDGTHMDGTVGAPMPVVDPTAQTQSIVIKVRNPQSIPESLVAKVRIVKTAHANAIALPKAAVLTNDVQSEYWVMRLADSITAVKVVIKKGIETRDRIEVLAPEFANGDRILLTGNFGLADTAKVKVTAVNK